MSLNFLGVFEQVSRADWLEDRRLVESTKLDSVVAQLQDSVSRLSEQVSNLCSRQERQTPDEERIIKLAPELSVASNVTMATLLDGEED